MNESNRKEIFHKEYQKGKIKNCINFFSFEMKKELESHLNRPGWWKESTRWLFERLLEEITELEFALEGNKPRKEVIKEAVDVANFAMMIADVYKKSGIKEKEE